MTRRTSSFTRAQVEDYEKQRYRSIDQRMVHHREDMILKRLIDSFAGIPGFALDLPCGYGRFSRFLIERQYRLISCDYSFEMVKRAGEKKQADYPGEVSRGVAADAKKNLPFKPGVFELVLCMRLMHHVHDPEERAFILKECARVSRKWLILSFYQTCRLHRIQRLLRKGWKKNQAHIKMIGAEDLRALAEKTGLVPVKKIPLFRGLHAQQIILFRKKDL